MDSASGAPAFDAVSRAIDSCSIFASRRMERVRNSAAQSCSSQAAERANSLAHCLAIHDGREEALCQAYTGSGLPMSAVAAELGLSVSRISRPIARIERARGKT
jgi:putative transposase